MNRDYEVGFRKPPKASRWKPGQSGNPYGRSGHGNRPAIASPNPRLSKLAKRKVTVTKDGRQRQVDVAEALDLSLLQKALAGNRIALERLRAALELAEAAMREDAIHRHGFWSDWRTRHANASLNWPRTDGQTPVVPHPLDIVIDPISHKVMFVGPMAVDELPLFDAHMAAVELLLIEAENLSDRGLDTSSVRQLAQALFGTMAPSMGGPSYAEPEDAYVHRYVATVMTIRAMTKADRLQRKGEMEAVIDRGHRLVHLGAARRSTPAQARTWDEVLREHTSAAKVKPR